MAERNLSIRLSVVDGGKVKAELSEIGEKGERSLKKIEAAAQPAGNGLKFLSSAANDAKFQLQAATDRLGMLGSVLGKLGPAGLIAGASIAALGVGITALVMPVTRVGDEFFKLSQKTGVSVEALTALDYAAKLSDVSTEGLTKGLQRLSIALFDSRLEGAEGSKALQALGVAATDAHGQIRPTEQVLLDLAEKFADMPDGADKAALAIKLFGREGLNLIPFLNQGRDGITALMEEAQRLGLVMSEDVARASEVLNDNLTRLSAIFEGVQRQVGAAVIPVLADFTEQVVLAQTETGSFSKLDFNSLANSIISDLIRIQIQRAITLPLANFAMSLFAPAASAALPLGSGDLMGVNANIAHSGGLLGSDGLPSRQVDPGLFAGARRFHTGGLVSGEVPIIARQGEAVFTPGQLRALGGAVAAKPQVNVEVNVINRASGVETRVEQQQQAEHAHQRLLLVVQGLKKLFGDEHFVNLLRAEGLDTLPKYLAERIDNFAATT